MAHPPKWSVRPDADVPDHSDISAVLATQPRDAFFAAPSFFDAFASVFGDRAACDYVTLNAGPSERCFVPIMRCRRWVRPSLAPRFDYLPGDEALMRAGKPGLFPLRQISPILGLEAAQMRLAMLVDDQADRTRVFGALGQWLRGQKGWDIGVFPINATDVNGFAAAMAAQGMTTLTKVLYRRYFTLEAIKPSSELIAQGSQKFRQNLRRAENLAAKEGVGLKTVVGAEAEKMLPRVARLAAQSWKAPDNTADNKKAEGQAILVPYAGHQQAFFETLARDARTQPVITVAEGPGGDEAICLGFLAQGSMITSVIFQRPRTGAASYGRLVLQAMIDVGLGAGARRVDYNANAPWVSAYADTEATYHNAIVLRPGLKGAILRTMGKTVGRLTNG